MHSSLLSSLVTTAQTEFIKLEAREKANEIRMKVGLSRRHAQHPSGSLRERVNPCVTHPLPLLLPPLCQTKADSDLEKQMAVLNAKTKLAEEFDRKEKDLAMAQRV